MIGNFPFPQVFNPGGYRTFSFIPYNEVQTFPMIKNGAALLPVGLAPLSSWRKGYSTYQTLQFNEEQDSIEAGNFYKPILSGFLPGNSIEIINLITLMEAQRYFLVQAVDARGMTVLVGTPGSPLIFTAKFSSGQNRSDARGYSFQFTGTTLNRAPTYPF